MGKYIEVKNFDEATHWVAESDIVNSYSNVTVGKAYEIKLKEDNQEHYIVDDVGVDSLIFLAHEGKLIKVE